MHVARSRRSTSACLVTQVCCLQNHDVQKWFFFRWEVLDLDYFLGDYTEDEKENIPWAPEISVETDSSDGGLDDAETQPQPSKRKQANPTLKDRPVYVRPECGKKFLSISGFPGHMLRKHSISRLKGIFT